MAPLSAETCTLLLVILGAAALLRIPGVLFSIIKRYWKSYDDIPPAVIERMEAVGRLLPYWLELRKHPQFPTEVREQIELLAEVKERFTYTLLWIQMRDRERGWFPLRESWEDREIFVEVAKTLVRQADDHTPTVEHEVLRWFELHPITLEAESEDEDEGEAAGEVGDGGSEDSKT